MRVRSGLEVLVEDSPELVRGSRVGLICHPSSVDRELNPAWELIRSHAGGRIVRLFAPEHGVGGQLQDMAEVVEDRDPLSGLPVVSLYGACEDSLTPSLESIADLDVLVADLQDVGSRYYTFANTVIRALPVAGKAGIKVIVADRPNPINGIDVEGGLVDAEFASFVGELPVTNRHGLTLGELCLMAAERRDVDVELVVVPAKGWVRSDWWDETDLPWVLPSPNMPTLDTATVYPGGCLLEGTNLSEGRGTTRPFELVGAPWLDAASISRRLEGWALPGVAFRPVTFVPAFQKHAGELCGGVQIHVTDRSRFRPLLTGLALVISARSEAPDRFRWRTEPYEFVSDKPAFDLLAGTETWRLQIEQGAEPREIADSWGEDQANMLEIREQFGLYS